LAAYGLHTRIAMFAAIAAVVLSVGAAGLAAAKDRKARLQEALEDHAIVGDWNYDDIDRAFRRAKKERKPVCVVFR